MAAFPDEVSISAPMYVIWTHNARDPALSAGAEDVVGIFGEMALDHPQLGVRDRHDLRPVVRDGDRSGLTRQRSTAARRRRLNVRIGIVGNDEPPGGQPANVSRSGHARTGDPSLRAAQIKTIRRSAPACKNRRSTGAICRTLKSSSPARRLS